jgi:SNF2 family DNA or RNA helicase
MKWKTKPYAHQRDEWELSKDAAARAILWEQGTGKTKLIIDTARHLFDEGEIDGVLILAPNGVHDNWVVDELPAHLAGNDWDAFAYFSGKASTKWHQKALEELFEARFPWLCMSYEAFMTKRRKRKKGEAKTPTPPRGRETAERFLRERRALYVCDESQRIKTPSAKRTKAIAASGKHAPYRRILSGTPVTNTPFDIYSQYRFLDWNFWKERGFARFEAFKTYFAIWETFVKLDSGQFKRENDCTPEELSNVQPGRFSRPAQFRNFQELHGYVMEIATRVKKEDVLDLPPKVYTKRRFDLSSEQKRVYKSLRDDCIAMLENGELVTTPLVVTQLLRLQQITCGYIHHDDCETVSRFPDNPRLAALKDTLEDVDGSGIIFARFREDIDQIVELLGEDAVRYDGQTSPEARQKARKDFQAGDVRWFVANPAAAATGLTLHKAATVVYYSNSFNLEHRLQSEDRAHRIGQERTVLYIDLVARGTVDSKIVTALRKKLNIASKITGDTLAKWL